MICGIGVCTGQYSIHCGFLQLRQRLASVSIRSDIFNTSLLSDYAIKRLHTVNITHSEKFVNIFAARKKEKSKKDLFLSVLTIYCYPKASPKHFGRDHVPISSRTTSPAMISPATDGTNAHDAGTTRSPSLVGAAGSSVDQTTLSRSMPCFFSSCRITLASGQTEVS